MEILSKEFKTAVKNTATKVISKTTNFFKVSAATVALGFTKFKDLVKEAKLIVTIRDLKKGGDK